MNTDSVYIVIPVFRGLSDIQKCLHSLLGSPGQPCCEVVLIDDASFDPLIRKFLEKTAEENSHVTLLRNQTNLGFVKSANLGMQYAPGKDVLLLNSDTEVSGNWLERISACAYQDPAIGIVSPFSNNATILSYPRFCRASPLPENRNTASLDKLFRRTLSGKWMEIPTAVGFCMYIKRAVIRDVGYFDADAFGRGYGEESDFCLRAGKKGWKSVLCADTFVYHKGGVSFGKETDERQSRAISNMEKRHPGYIMDIARHIHLDAARVFRIRVLMEEIRTSHKPSVLVITHDMGGGVEKHVNDMAEVFSGKISFVFLRPAENGFAKLTFLSPGAEENALYFNLVQEMDAFIRCISILGISGAHVHHVMGFDPCFFGFLDTLSIPYDVTVHDYYLICGSPTLTDQRGMYCGHLSNRDEICTRILPLPDSRNCESWRSYWGKFLISATRVIFPSYASWKIYETAYPEISPTIAYHPEPDYPDGFPLPWVRPVRKKGKMRILVTGAISREKGADILEKTALHARKNHLPLEFHLLGYAYRTLDKAVVTHGPYYDRTEADEKIRAISPHLAWFPALWPETYSYTLSIALGHGLPVAATDLGAFPERLANRPFSYLLSWETRAEQWAEYFFSLAQKWKSEPAEPGVSQSRITEENMSFHPDAADGSGMAGCFSLEDDFYHAHYTRGFTAAPAGAAADEAFAGCSEKEETGGDQREITEAWIRNHAFPKNIRTGQSAFSGREKLVRMMLRLRMHPFAAPLFRFIPYNVQRSIKRRFSKKPVHEILRS